MVSHTAATVTNLTAFPLCRWNEPVLICWRFNTGKCTIFADLYICSCISQSDCACLDMCKRYSTPYLPITAAFQSQHFLETWLDKVERSAWQSKDQKGMDPEKLFEVDKYSVEFRAVKSLFKKRLPTQDVDRIALKTALSMRP